MRMEPHVPDNECDQFTWSLNVITFAWAELWLLLQLLHQGGERLAHAQVQQVSMRCGARGANAR